MSKYTKISFLMLFLGLLVMCITTYMIVQRSEQPKANMTILGEKYSNHFFDSKTKINVFWKISNGKIHFALKSPGQGWVGIGFNPKGPVMNGADIFMGFVENNKTYINEEFANTPYSHEVITKAGGRDCILSYKGKSTPSGTILTFVRDLKSGGPHDKPITNKVMTVMLAYSNGKNFTKYHGPNHNEVHINFFKKTGSKHKSLMLGSHLTSYEIGFITWAVLFILSGLVGLASSFVEKDVSKEEYIEKKQTGILPFLGILALIAGEIVAIVWFIVDLYSNAMNSEIGLIAGLCFILMGLIVLLYRKYYISDEVIAQDMNDEIPW